MRAGLFFLSSIFSLIFNICDATHYTSMHKIQMKIGKMRSMFKSLQTATLQLDPADSKFVKNALWHIHHAEKHDPNFENPVSIYKIVAHSWDIRMVLENNKLPGDFCNQHLGINNTQLSEYLFDGWDVRGCLKALVELQWVYSLSAREVSMGYFGDSIPRAAPLNASQCELMTFWSQFRQFYQQEDEWLVETLRRSMSVIHKKPANQAFQFFSLERDTKWYLEKMTALTLQQGLVGMAKSLMASLTHLYGYHRFSSMFYKLKVKNDGGIFKKCHKEVSLLRLRHRYSSYAGETWDMFDQRRLCTKARYGPKGYCRYAAPNAFYKVGPIREEVFSDSPYIRVWHKVVHKHEIEHIKRVSLAHLERARVMDHNNHSNSYASDIRTSENMFIFHQKNSLTEIILRRIDARIDALSGTTLEDDYRNHENYQVGNYGIGGFYASHTDYVDRPGLWYDPPTGQTTNRYATGMIYASDVKVGGGTMFPDLNITVLPREGSMVFWYNMLRHGEVDPRTRHCGCPVLSGSKWVANKWIKYHGHHLSRPCKLEKTNE